MSVDKLRKKINEITKLFCYITESFHILLQNGREIIEKASSMQVRGRGQRPRRKETVRRENRRNRHIGEMGYILHLNKKQVYIVQRKYNDKKSISVE